MSLFIEENDLIKITIRYFNQGNKLTIFKEGEPKEPIAGKVETDTFELRIPNWEDSVKIATASTLVNGNTGAVIVNPHIYTDTKIKLLLKKWSLKDKDGNSVLVTEEKINKLHPKMIEAIDYEFNKETILNFCVPEIKEPDETTPVLNS